LGSLVIFSLPAGGGTPADASERVRALVQQLDDEQFHVRNNADQALRGLGTEALPALNKELNGSLSLEARQRLASVIDHLSQIHWQRAFDDALRQARQTGKPVLVFSAPGLLSVPASIESAAMQRRTFADLKVVEYLNANFVTVWHDPTPGELHARQIGQPVPQFTAEQVRDCKEGSGTAIHTFLCAPDGCVLQHLVGFHGPEKLLKEAARIPELAKGPRPVPAAETPEAAQELMKQSQALLNANAADAQVQVLHAQSRRRFAPFTNPLGKHVWDVAVELERSMRAVLYLGC
jgi:hypothetical protein